MELRQSAEAVLRLESDAYELMSPPRPSPEVRDLSSFIPQRIAH
jgi:hypothetical protein